MIVNIKRILLSRHNPDIQYVKIVIPILFLASKTKVENKVTILSDML